MLVTLSGIVIAHLLNLYRYLLIGKNALDDDLPLRSFYYTFIREFHPFYYSCYYFFLLHAANLTLSDEIFVLKIVLEIVEVIIIIIILIRGSHVLIYKISNYCNR